MGGADANGRSREVLLRGSPARLTVALALAEKTGLDSRPGVALRPGILKFLGAPFAGDAWAGESRAACGKEREGSGDWIGGSTEDGGGDVGEITAKRGGDLVGEGGEGGEL